MLQSEYVRTPGKQTQHFECRSSDESTLELLPNTLALIIIMTIIIIMMMMMSMIMMMVDFLSLCSIQLQHIFPGNNIIIIIIIIRIDDCCCLLPVGTIISGGGGRGGVGVMCGKSHNLITDIEVICSLGIDHIMDIEHIDLSYLNIEFFDRSTIRLTILPCDRDAVVHDLQQVSTIRPILTCTIT